MLKVNNRAVIANLSRKSLMANRLRNIIAIVAIAMTAMMFTSVFTIAASMMDAMEQETMRQVGSSMHGGFKFLTQDEYDKLMTHPSIKDYSSGGVVGFGDNPELGKVSTEIRWTEDKKAQWGFTYPTVGDLPRSGRELATSTLVLDALGVPHELGAVVPLTFTTRGVTYNEEFTLCGWWAGDSVAAAQMAYLSREYASEVAPLYTENYIDNGSTDVACYISADVFFASANDIENKMIRVIVDSGLDPAKIPTGVNWAYLGGGELDLTALLIAATVLLIIFAAGYLIIYNIFYISVAKDTRYYGLLKTIGTTPRQLRRLVRRQALLLSAVGIPVGLLLGWLVGSVLYPLVAGRTILVGSAATVNPIIFVMATLFALVTVFISCSKPCKVAATVSPIEALLSTEATHMCRANARRSAKVSAGRMGLQNLQRNHKRVATVVASLTLSVVLLNTVFGIVGGFDLDKFIANKVVSDIAVSNTTLLGRYRLHYLPSEAVDSISSMEGVRTASPVYMSEALQPPTQGVATAVAGFLEMLHDRNEITDRTHADMVTSIARDGLSTHVYGIDQLAYDKLTFFGDKPSWEAFASGDYIIASALTDKGAHPVYNSGELVTVEGRSYTLLALASIPYPASCMHGHMVTLDLTLPTSEYRKLYPEAQPLHLLLSAEEGKLDSLEQSVAAYCGNSNDVAYRSKSTYVTEFAGLQQMYIVVGGTLSAILGFVGLLNFVNSMATSILSRRRELAMLQSVGMTRKQLTTMLTAEGLGYAGITAAVSLTIGNLLCVLLTLAIAQQMWFFSYSFTILPMLLALLLMTLLACVVPELCYRAACRDTVVERLRESAE